GLIMSGKKLFGTAPSGGSGANGVVFSFDTGTKSLTVLHDFSAGNTNAAGTLTNSDGVSPNCQLLLIGTNLFGTASAGGTNGLGTVYRVSTNGAAFTTLRHCDTNDASPNSGLVLSGSRVFGMAGSIVYELGTNGSGFSNLLQFLAPVDATDPP